MSACANCGKAGACDERCPAPSPAGLLRREAQRSDAAARSYEATGWPGMAAHMRARADLFRRCADAAETCARVSEIEVRSSGRIGSVVGSDKSNEARSVTSADGPPPSRGGLST